MDTNLKKFVYDKNNWTVSNTKANRPSVGKLLWIYCGKTQVILENQPFNYLNSRKRELMKEPQYSKGVFKVTY